MDDQSQLKFVFALGSFRMKYGLTKKEMAKLFDVHYTTYLGWERGLYYPRDTGALINFLKEQSTIDYALLIKSDKPFKRIKTVVEEPDEEFIEFIKNMRRSLDYTVGEFADLLDEPPKDVNDFESGIKEPRNKDLFIRRVREAVKKVIREKRSI